MPRIELDATAVVSRTNTLSKLFCILTRDRRGFSIKPSRTGLVVFSGNGIPRPTRSYVQTKLPDVLVSYFEIWSEADAPKQLRLDKCYLHLDKQGYYGSDPEKILALHSDLDCVEDTLENYYKRGPHMHVTAGMHPFTDSHIALSLGDLEETCSSLNNLMGSLQRNLMMIDHEFLSRL